MITTVLPSSVLNGAVPRSRIALNTAQAWLTVLEATFQAIILRPYFANVGKRLVKTAKVYFLDAGTLCYLTGLKDPEHATVDPMGGLIFASAVLAEIIKTISHRGEPQVYFWRTATGVEVDLVVAEGGRLIPLEIKLPATPRPAMARPLNVFRKDLQDQAAPGRRHPPRRRPAALSTGCDRPALPRPLTRKVLSCCRPVEHLCHCRTLVDKSQAIQIISCIFCNLIIDLAPIYGIIKRNI
jgi:hypothetical protein